MAKDQAKVEEGDVLDFEPGFAYVTIGIQIGPKIIGQSKNAEGKFTEYAFRQLLMKGFRRVFGSAISHIRDVEFFPF